MPKKLSIEEFITRSNNIYSNKYNYTNVDYINKDTKVIIICNIHGEFEKTPGNHLRGQGCPGCSLINRANKRRKSKQTFIEEAIIIHGNKYNYDNINYTNNRKNITIICNIHGEFNQTPNNHLKGKGCPKCGIISIKNKNKKTIEVFLKEATNIHGNKYNYDKVDYINIDTKITIICDIHGEFKQIPYLHLNGNRCPKCAKISSINKQKKTREVFINEAIEIHGNKYNYDKVKYINTHTKITIICDIHGDFKQIPYSHINNKSGCPKCCNLNYSKKAIKWIHQIEELKNIKIQHALSEDGEYRIPKTNFKADGYCKETNTIYEFYGDYWHGNPEKFNKNDINKVNGKTFRELFDETIKRENILKELGYNVVIIWESDYDKNNI